MTLANPFEEGTASWMLMESALVRAEWAEEDERDILEHIARPASLAEGAPNPFPRGGRGHFHFTIALALAGLARRLEGKDAGEQLSELGRAVIASAEAAARAEAARAILERD